MVCDDADRPAFVLVVAALRVVASDQPPLLIGQGLDKPGEALLGCLELGGEASRAGIAGVRHVETIVAPMDSPPAAGARQPSTVCPGCGLKLPGTGLSWEPKSFASPECWQIHGEIAGFELAHPELAGRFHQLTVDAYGAQHSGGDGRGIRIVYSLVGLHLALDRGWSGVAVRRAHQGMGRPQPSWPAFRRSADVGSLTVLDVARAGVRAGSVSGHAEVVQRWAAAVWAAWAPRHEEVAALTDRVVRR